MTPDPLENILKDVKNDEIHQKIDKYKCKLMAFKGDTTLWEFLDKRFPSPDYGKRLAIKFNGEVLDCTIEAVEACVMNIAKKIMHSHGQSIYLGWKSATLGSVKLIFTIYTDSIDISSESSLVILSQACHLLLTILFAEVLKLLRLYNLYM